MNKLWFAMHPNNKQGNFVASMAEAIVELADAGVDISGLRFNEDCIDVMYDQTLDISISVIYF